MRYGGQEGSSKIEAQSHNRKEMSVVVTPNDQTAAVKIWWYEVETWDGPELGGQTAHRVFWLSQFSRCEGVHTTALWPVELSEIGDGDSVPHGVVMMNSPGDAAVSFKLHPFPPTTNSCSIRAMQSAYLEIDVPTPASPGWCWQNCRPELGERLVEFIGWCGGSWRRGGVTGVGRGPNDRVERMDGLPKSEECDTTKFVAVEEFPFTATATGKATVR